MHVLYRGLKTYTLDDERVELTLRETKINMHGNDNIRTQIVKWRIYEILSRIDPTVLDTALAAVFNGTVVPLDAEVGEDCTLDIITADDKEGGMIYFRSMAFLIAQTLYQYNSAYALLDMAVAEDSCLVTFSTSQEDAPSALAISTLLNEQFEGRSTIQVSNILQKATLLESYLSLHQPYAEKLLCAYDEYDFVPVVVRDQVALPARQQEIYALFPAALQGFSVTILKQDTTFSVKVLRKMGESVSC